MKRTQYSDAAGNCAQPAADGSPAGLAGFDYLDRRRGDVNGGAFARGRVAAQREGEDERFHFGFSFHSMLGSDAMGTPV